MDVETKEYLTYTEVANRLGLAESYIRQMVTANIFHPVRPLEIGMRRSHRKYINIQQVEAYERGEIPATVRSPKLPPPPAIPNGNGFASMPSPGGGLASSYAYNASILNRHSATYLLLLTMVEDMMGRGIPASDAYKLTFEVAPTLLSELDREEDIMQKTPREIISKVTGKDHPAAGKVESIMREHGINLDRPIDGSVPALPDTKS